MRGSHVNKPHYAHLCSTLTLVGFSCMHTRTTHVIAWLLCYGGVSATIMRTSFLTPHMPSVFVFRSARRRVAALHTTRSAERSDCTFPRTSQSTAPLHVCVCVRVSVFDAFDKISVGVVRVVMRACVSVALYVIRTGASVYDPMHMCTI